jgi:hypothetical protein
MRQQLSGVLFSAIVILGGCQTWRQTPLAPARDLPPNARLVKTDGRTVRLESGHLSPDSVIGEQPDGQHISVPADSVAFVQVRSFSWLRTLGVVYAGLFVVGLLVGERL